MKMVGDTIGPDGTSAQKVMSLHFKLNCRSDLHPLLNGIEEHFHIYDEQGEDLVLELMK